MTDSQRGTKPCPSRRDSKRVWASSTGRGKLVQKLNGTVEYPPHGKRIEREMLRLCEEAEIDDPTLFGCGTSWHLLKEFTDKWLPIFKNPPPEANYLFEESMGNDCWAVEGSG